MATSVTQGLSDDQTGGASYRIARRVTLADSMVVRANSDRPAKAGSST